MICPEPHIKEELRLQALDSYEILDSPYESAYDDITAMAAEISKTPIALVSFIDKKRQWFKSHHGIGIREAEKEFAFCAHAINTSNEVFIIPDTRKDPRFRENPFVVGDPWVVFYAGVPLRDADNLPLGNLCILDNKPRQLKANEVQLLKVLASQVMLLLKHRKHTAELSKSIISLVKKKNELEQFNRNIAHDLKSPLINISEISKHLSSHHVHDLDDEGKTLVSLIKRSSDILKGLVDDTLEYYTDESTITEDVSLIDLKDFYNQIFELFNHDHSIEINLKTSLSQISLNSTILYQIMINLISNGIRYNDKKNIIIEIGTFEYPEFYEFYIQDNGPGIPEHLHQKVFDLFMVGYELDKDGRKGKGIGLATVKKFVEILGGKIWLENGKENGCKFTFQLKKQPRNHKTS